MKTKPKLNSIEKHDKESFMKFYDEYHLLVYAAIQKYCLREDLYDDVAVESLLQVYESLDVFDSSRSNISTFIYRIVRNVSYKMCERDKGSKEKIVDCDALDRMVCPSRNTFHFSILQTVLTEEEYSFIYAIYVERASIIQAALDRNMNYSTAKHLHKTILKKLETQLEEFLQ